MVKKGSGLSRGEAVLLMLVTFLGGIVVGFFLAPIKKGLTIGSYNGNCQGKEEDEEKTFNEDLAMEMGELR